MNGFRSCNSTTPSEEAGNSESEVTHAVLPLVSPNWRSGVSGTERGTSGMDGSPWTRGKVFVLGLRNDSLARRSELGLAVLDSFPELNSGSEYFAW